MAVTQTVLLNQALAVIGEPAVANLNDGSNASNTFNTLWDNIRTSVLTLYPWNACTVRTSLLADTIPARWAADTAYALGDEITDSNEAVQKCTVAGTSGSSAPTWSTTSTTTDGTATWTIQSTASAYVTPSWGYEYQYTLPSNVLRVMGVAPVSTWPIWPENFYTSTGFEQQDYKVENGVVLAHETTLQILYTEDQNPPTDSMLQSLLVAALASAMAFPITHDPNIVKEMGAKFQMAFAKAKHIDSQQGKPDTMPESEWLAGRY